MKLWIVGLYIKLQRLKGKTSAIDDLEHIFMILRTA